MDQKPRIALLCGGRFAYPTIQLLGFEKYLCGVATGKAEKTVVESLEAGLSPSAIPYINIRSRHEEGKLTDWLKELKADAVFSVCFPFRLSNEVLSIHPQRFINFHTGPLPAYRGAMPIFEVIRARETASAISVHLMNEHFDKGDMLFTESVPVMAEDTFGSLATRLSDRCALAALNTSQMLEFSTSLISSPQDENEARYYAYPGLTDTIIRWDYMCADEIDALVRACNPWNQGADTTLMGKPVKILATSYADEAHQAAPGTILEITHSHLKAACIDNQVLYIYILSDETGITTISSRASKIKPGFRFSA